MSTVVNNNNKVDIDTFNGNNIKETPKYPISEIYEDHTFNCRGRVSPLDVIPLQSNIKNVGLLSPVVIQNLPSNLKASLPGKKYRLVAGYRRMAAIRGLGWTEVPAILRDEVDEDQIRAINLIENIERSDLNILQEAQAIEYYVKKAYRPEKICELVNQSRTWLQVRLDLLALEPEIQAEAATGLLTQSQIKAIKNMGTKEERFEAVKTIKNRKMLGEKNIKVGKTQFNPNTKKRRDPHQIGWLIEHLLDTVGEGLHTRLLAWANGNISDGEMFAAIKEYANENDKLYHIPNEPFN